MSCLTELKTSKGVQDLIAKFERQYAKKQYVLLTLRKMQLERAAKQKLEGARKRTKTRCA